MHNDNDEFLELINQLHENDLFKGISKEQINNIICKYNYIKKVYKKNEVIAFEGDECNSLGLIISGSVEIERILPSGKTIIIKKLNKNSIFGEAIIFSKKNEYPAMITAAEDCMIINIKKEEILKLCKEENQFLQNFICMLSDKIFMLNRKIKNISFTTIKQKVVNFILEQSEKQDNKIIKLNGTKEDIAARLGIPRPSLSRELISLRNNGLIEFDRNIIKIKNYELLEELLFR